MRTSDTGNDVAAFGADESIDVIVFTTRWCPHCLRLKHALRRHEISWHEVDIETDCAAADFVARANNGNRTVPTVVFRDGTVVTNPPIRTVLDTLVALAPSGTSPTVQPAQD